MPRRTGSGHDPSSFHGLFEGFVRLGQAENAEILDCSIKAVDVRIYRARKQLRELLGSVLEKEA